MHPPVGSTKYNSFQSFIKREIQFLIMFQVLVFHLLKKKKKKKLGFPWHSDFPNEIEDDMFTSDKERMWSSSSIPSI